MAPLVCEHQVLQHLPTAAQLAALEAVNTAYRNEVIRPVVVAGIVQLRATQYVGVLRLGGQLIKILPKTHRADAPGEEAANVAPANLLSLLTCAPDVSLHSITGVAGTLFWAGASYCVSEQVSQNSGRPT